MPVPQTTDAIESSEDESNDAETDGADEIYEPETETKKPHLLNKEELNDLVRDLSLSKEKAEALGSRLQQWNLLQEGHKNLSALYQLANDVCFCTDVNGLKQQLGYEHTPNEWSIFYRF